MNRPQNYLNKVRSGIGLAFLTIILAAFQNCSGEFHATPSEGFKSNASLNPDESSPPSDECCEEETSTPPVSEILIHGKEVKPEIVGPKFLGLANLPQYNSANVNASAPFVKQVSGSASYDGFTVSGSHFLIEGVQINGGLWVQASLPVVIRGCKIFSTGYTALNINSSSPVYVLYSDVGGASASSSVDTAITVSSHNVVVYRNHISNMHGDGMSIGSKNVQILENLMDNFIAKEGAHHDGIQATGGNNGMVISRNRIMLNFTETGAINLGPWTAPVTEVTVDANYLAGGGYTFYGGQASVGAQTYVQVTNNIFGTDYQSRSGYWGPVAYWQSGSTNVWSNNTYSNGGAVNP